MTTPLDLDPFVRQRESMVETKLRARGILDGRVLGAMARVPRHEFAPERYRDQAYEDHPLPIAENQTISQPYIVAIMLQAIAIAPGDRVLEVGTGSGYVTALLAELAAEVISIERHQPLSSSARVLLQRMRYQNVRLITGDGSRGFAEAGPYNAILVSAAAPQLPWALVQQLAEGGRMIIPVGRNDSQQLQFIEMRNGEARVTPRELCRFVPLVAEDGR